MIVFPLLVTPRDGLLVALITSLMLIVIALAWSSSQPRITLRDRVSIVVRLPVLVTLASVPALMCAVGLWLSITWVGLAMTPVAAPAPPLVPRDVPALYTEDFPT